MSRYLLLLPLLFLSCSGGSSAVQEATLDNSSLLVGQSSGGYYGLVEVEASWGDLVSLAQSIQLEHIDSLILQGVTELEVYGWKVQVKTDCDLVDDGGCTFCLSLMSLSPFCIDVPFGVNE